MTVLQKINVATTQGMLQYISCLFEVVNMSVIRFSFYVQHKENEPEKQTSFITVIPCKEEET